MKLDENEVKVLKRILLSTIANRSSLSYQEQLSYYDNDGNLLEDPSEEFLQDAIEGMAEKAGITPEETW